MYFYTEIRSCNRVAKLDFVCITSCITFALQLARMSNEYLYKKTDHETNMQSYVIQSTTGKFHACLMDLDSGEVVPHIAVCNDLETAIDKASKMI